MGDDMSYDVTLERHPTHGLGINLKCDDDNNPRIDSLKDWPDGSPGAAQTCGVRAPSLILAIGGTDVVGKGLKAVASPHPSRPSAPAAPLWAPRALGEYTGADVQCMQQQLQVRGANGA